MPNASATVIDAGGAQVAAAGDQAKVYDLASVTKLLSAYGILIAVEEGIFELATPLPLGGESSAQANDAAPADPAAPTATVRQLLCHASGVRFASREPEKQPGERRIYSSAGYEILADAVARESGIPFPDYLREAVFEPLGMRTAELRGSAGHGAVASAQDLEAFAREVLHPTLLDPSTLDEATTCQYPELNGVVPGYGMQKPCPWGLGFEIKGAKRPHWTGERMPEGTIGHFGQSGTFLWLHRATGRAMLALTDRPFAEWAKEYWAGNNDAVWAQLASGD